MTIRDVATLAGVSLGTVSNVLNSPGVVAPVTRDRVRDVIRRTGFVRSTAARQLRGGRSRAIGVVVLDIANPFFTEMVKGVEHVLRARGYVLMLCSTDESIEQERGYLRLLEEHRVDGLLITPVASDLQHVSDFAAHGIPTVLIGREGTVPGFCSATVDDVRGGELAARHLLDLGHRVIAFVNGPDSIHPCADRRRGARRAIRGAGSSIGATLKEIRVRSTTVGCGEASVQRLLELEPRPTAVMCANDLLALGVLRGLAAAGLSVPEDIAVVGYDDVTFASMLAPGLTSVLQPKYELGAAAAELLLEEATGDSHEHRDVRFEPTLVVRGSSGRRRTLTLS